MMTEQVDLVRLAQVLKQGDTTAHAKACAAHMVADRARPTGELRPGWVAYQDAAGTPYYHNARTGVTTWEKPVGPSRHNRQLVELGVVPVLVKRLAAPEDSVKPQKPQMPQP